MLPLAAIVHVAPLQVAPAIAFGALYAVRARTLAGQGRPVAQARQWCWYGGMAILVVALISPLGALADDLFYAHMAEHLLIADVGALLLVLGLTGPLLAPLLRAPGLGWMRALAHPVPAFGLWAGDLLFWHLVGPHEAAVRHDAVHAIQHMLFVGLGINMWMALLGPLPKPSWFGNAAKLGYIVAVRLTTTVLANVFVWTGHAFFGVYAPGERAHGISPASDQVVAGSIMMVEGSILTLCLFCWLFLRSAREGQERQELLELAAAGGVALDARRAARAVAAGRGGELRRRIEDERSRRVSG
ncbi:MAG: putative rane protein [Solirubrobacteraceae bacterium]|jgi:cytochrome c oxidase assembly factor CtaG|nr:putative rane protein [Solirubrobacteraceae bacterium]